MTGLRIFILAYLYKCKVFTLNMNTDYVNLCVIFDNYKIANESSVFIYASFNIWRCQHYLGDDICGWNNGSSVSV